MDTKPFVSSFFCFILFSLLSGSQQVDAGSHQQHHRGNRHLFDVRPKRLFVFGDSYADTGNNRKSQASSWKEPYGITFPGKPSGRFSDGRVLTDYAAKFVGVKSPIPYKWRKVGPKHVKYGMNFAYGGTGVFDTLVPEPNMTTQIDFLQQLVNGAVYTPLDIESSVALVSVAGNDYSTFLNRNGSAQGLQSLIPRVVNQLALNLKRVHDLGVKRVAVTALQPLGCLPRSTVASSFQQCNGTENSLVSMHNLLLQQAVAKLNNETKNSTFVILDLYKAFMTTFTNKADSQGYSRFENPLKPCCVGISKEYSCGSIDPSSGEKKYTVCENPAYAFFWDTVHPTQQGWHVVYTSLLADLKTGFK